MQDGARSGRAIGDPGDHRTLNRSAAVAITIQRLVEDATRFWPREERLVLDAHRRLAKGLNDASVEDLAEYVSALTAEQLRGVVSNVKGIYHELLFVHAENIDGDDVTARIFEGINHPGSDAEFIVEGEVIEAIQLKAVTSLPNAMREHLVLYPDIKVIATEEVPLPYRLSQLPDFPTRSYRGKWRTSFLNFPTAPWPVKSPMVPQHRPFWPAGRQRLRSCAQARFPGSNLRRHSGTISWAT